MTPVPYQETMNAPSSALGPPAEDELLPYLAAGRFHEAFERLFERFRDKVFRLTYSMLRDAAQAEDMSQETWVRIWKGLPGYHGQASLSTWIYTISRNTCLTELKRRAAHPTVSLQAPEMDGGLDRIPALQTAAPESGVDLDVQALLGQLPEKYRQVITLFYLEGKQYEEVASMLGLPLGTVKTFLFRAKKELLRLASRPPAALPITAEVSPRHLAPTGTRTSAVSGQWPAGPGPSSHCVDSERLWWRPRL